MHVTVPRDGETRGRLSKWLMRRWRPGPLPALFPYTMKRYLASLWSLLGARERRHYLQLQFVFLLTALFQVAGVASVAPFIAVVSNPTILHRNAILRWITEILGTSSDRSALIALAFLTMALMVVSNAVMAVTTWLSARFSVLVGMELQADLLASALHADMNSYSDSNSAERINRITQGATRLTYMVLQPAMAMVSQLFVLILLAVGVVIYDPTIAAGLALGILGGYIALFFIVRKRFTHHGGRSWQVGEQKQQILTESFGALKEIRLSGTEWYHQRRFETVASSGLSSDAALGLLADLPRFALETLAFCMLLGLAIKLLDGSVPSSDIVAVLSLYAMAGYRMLPAAQQVFKSASQIRANVDVVDEILPDVLRGRAIRARPATRSTAAIQPLTDDICLRGIWYRYPTGETDALRGATATIRRNRLNVVVGASGSGKSTLMDVLMGLLVPASGTVTSGSRDVLADVASWQRSIGYVPQAIFLLDASVRENVVLNRPDKIDDERVVDALADANLSLTMQQLPGGTEYRVGERGALLSGGQRQRIGIARALYNEASLLVMDEATSALDGQSEQEVLRSLLRLRETHTVVLVAHRVSSMKVADHIIHVKDGVVVSEGTFQELSETDAAFSQMVGASPVDALADRVAEQVVGA